MDDMNITKCRKCGGDCIVADYFEDGIKVSCTTCDNTLVIDKDDPFLKRLFAHGQEAYNKAKRDYIILRWNQQNEQTDK